MGHLSLFLFFLIFISAVLSNYASAGRDGTRIRGGNDALAGQFSYQVSLEVGGQSICGGGIITEWFVLSAAHCFITDANTFHGNTPSIKVVAGIHNLRSYSNTKQESDVFAVYIPRDYLRKGHQSHPLADISVIKLKQPFKLNREVTALNLPRPYDTFTGGRAVISGFGWNHVDVETDHLTGRRTEIGGSTNGKLRYAETNVIDQHECSRMYENRVDESLLCAQVIQRSAKSPEGVCSGDSGGPLVYNHYTLIGVVSTSPLGCVEDKMPGVYTRVSSYLSFIDKAIRDEVDYSILRKIMGFQNQPMNDDKDRYYVYGTRYEQTTTTTTTTTTPARPPRISAVKKSWRPDSFFFQIPSRIYNRPSWSINF